MFQTPKDSNGYDTLTQEQKDMLSRINAYAENVLGEIDPQKTRISFQLDKLKPVMQEIASERRIAVEDVFIEYMDLASIVSAKQDAKLKEDLDEVGLVNFSEI
ncbi:MAG: hypothetical protein SOV61_04890 [Lachnospiraceae bacterium]|nr:hypothetical protein [Lachnospiraceae bacterium]